MGGKGQAVGRVEPGERFFGSCVALLLLNLADGLFTLTFLQLGLAEELNPLMRMAYHQSPLLFMIVKLSAVSCGVLILWVHRRTRTARLAISLGLLVYVVIACWHLSYLARLLLV
jgi:hypothetical protein